MHSFLIVNLGLGDLMMGVYLLIVAVVDLQYRGVYAAYEVTWRASSLCQLAGFISTFSSELSVFTLTTITVDRLMVIKFPFGIHRLEEGVTRSVMVCVWILVTILAALPLTYLDYFKNFYGRSGVCLALHITNEKPNGWEYSVFIFLILNLLNFGVITVSYILMYSVARETQTAVRQAPETRLGEQGVATRMTLIVATDAACWLPIILLGIISLCGVTIPPKVFSWIAVFVLPLNAAVNPMLYTLSTAPVRKRFKYLKKKFISSLWGGRQPRSSSLLSGNRWASFRTRFSTDGTDIPPSTDTQIRVVKAKPAVCVYSPIISNSSPAYDRKLQGEFCDDTCEKNGEATPLRGTEIIGKGNCKGVGGQRALILQEDDSIPQDRGRNGLVSDEREIIPLKELTPSISAPKRSPRQHNGRKNISDRRYD
ncbi:hypothetical protein SK128_020615 [Halocaridina rubra]|uniref:G-protein coupled receptors family 1 profile domain-containing protein n=1 Tax=Halocaridina rubra TaxID=373956 RepID=A0AAN8XE59_HALRR